MSYPQVSPENFSSPPQYSQNYPASPLVQGQVAPPAYSDFLSYSPPAENENQTIYPVHFDTSIVPNGNILTPATVTPIDHLSTIACKNDSDGTLKCFDQALDSDPDELFRFFMSHLESPKQHIHVLGTHVETKRVKTKKGHRTERRTVTDISFTIDVTAFVSKGWSQIACVPEQGKASKSYRETLEEYCRSKNYLKEY